MPSRTSALARARAGWRRCPCRRNDDASPGLTANDLGQQVGDGDGRARERERRYALTGTEGLRAPVAPTEERGAVRNGAAIDLQSPVREVHDPVVGEAGARVEAALAVAVEPETGERDLHHENGARRVRVAIVARIAGDDADVWLRHRLVVQRHRHLGQDVPTRPKGAGENAHDQTDGRGVKTVLWLLADHRAAEQLDPILRPEDLGLDEPLVFNPRPLPFFHVHRCEGNARPARGAMYRKPDIDISSTGGRSPAWRRSRSTARPACTIRRATARASGSRARRPFSSRRARSPATRTEGS